MEHFMATPKGMRTRVFKLNAIEQVHVYSNDQTLILQIRREVPTEEDILATSIKAAVCLSPSQALSLAGELLEAASQQLNHQQEPAK
jgi:hypothetical protein